MLVLCLVLAVLASGWIVYRQFRGSAGPLQVWHNLRLSGPAKVGQPYVWATVELKNPTDDDLTVDQVKVETGRLRVSTLALGRPDHWPVGGLYDGWPPEAYKTGDLVSPAGVVLRKRGGATLIFGELVMPRPGRYPIGPNITIDYHIGHTAFHKEAHIWADVLYTEKR